MKTLTDTHGRTISYMRISVTDRCNMRCRYCVPGDGFQMIPHADILSYEEILRIVRLASDLGVNKFRITGGEPLVRKGIIKLIGEINSIDGVETTFTTNGLLLEEYAEELKAAGVKRLNISIDSMREDRFRDITGGGSLDKVMRGIEKAYSVGFDPIKLNFVVMKGVNDDEFLDYIGLVKSRPYHARFIEFMPVGDNDWGREKFIPSEEIEKMVGDILPLKADALTEKGSPSRNYNIDGYAGKVGFISPVSRHFCDSCNRIRLTSDGHIKSCLLRKGEVDIKTAMRKGIDDDELRRLISTAVMLKPSGHLLDEGGPESDGRSLPMTQIGG